MGVKNNFQVVANNRFDKNFGGTVRGNAADAYLTGYQFVKFFNFPKQRIINNIVTGNSENTPPKVDKDSLPTFLEANTNAVTPPSGTLNRAEWTGLGGTKYSMPSNIDYGNTLTLKFIEFSGTPVMQIIHSWVRMIRDYRNGAMPDSEELSYNNKPLYCCNILYWTTKPDCRSVEYAALYTGCHPTKDPHDSFAGDVETADKLEIEIEFGIDYAWHEPWVYDKAAEWAKIYKDSGQHPSPEGNLQ